MAQTSEIIDRYGRPGRLKTKRIREFLAAGEGEWQGGVFVFHQRANCEADALRVRHSPTIGRITTCVTEQYGGSDSGFSMLRYPLRSGTSGVAFPALAKMGAGL